MLGAAIAHMLDIHFHRRFSAGQILRLLGSDEAASSTQPAAPTQVTLPFTFG